MTHCKKVNCTLSRISLHYQTVIDQKLTTFHQLFSWTLVGLSKCPIDKIIGSQGHLNVSPFPWVPCVQAKNCMTENVFPMNKSLYAGVHLLQFLNALTWRPITPFFKCIKLHQILSLFSTINVAYVMEINIFGRDYSNLNNLFQRY